MLSRYLYRSPLDFDCNAKCLYLNSAQKSLTYIICRISQCIKHLALKPDSTTWTHDCDIFIIRNLVQKASQKSTFTPFRPLSYRKFYQCFTVSQNQVHPSSSRSTFYLITEISYFTSEQYFSLQNKCIYDCHQHLFHSKLA